MNKYEIIYPHRRSNPYKRRRYINIFKRFYKVDKARSSNGESSGLGLSIAQCIVKEHNATIKFESLKYKGITFHINLPY